MGDRKWVKIQTRVTEGEGGVSCAPGCVLVGLSCIWDKEISDPTLKELFRGGVEKAKEREEEEEAQKPC